MIILLTLFILGSVLPIFTAFFQDKVFYLVYDFLSGRKNAYANIQDIADFVP